MNVIESQLKIRTFGNDEYNRGVSQSFGVFDRIDDFAIWDNSAIQHAYENNINPYTADIGAATGKVGIVCPYIESELSKNPYHNKFCIDGSYTKIYVPEFKSVGITSYHQNSQLIWVYLFDGSNCFYKKKKIDQIYFGSPEISSYNITNGYCDSTYSNNSNFYNFNMVAKEIAEEMQNNTNITFPVGGAVKVYNSTNDTYTIYLCSTHTANTTKHQGDFPIFLSWCLYQRSIITDDGTLGRDLKANGATVDSIIKKY